MRPSGIAELTAHHAREYRRARRGRKRRQAGRRGSQASWSRAAYSRRLRGQDEAEGYCDERPGRPGRSHAAEGGWRPRESNTPLSCVGTSGTPPTGKPVEMATPRLRGPDPPPASAPEVPAAAAPKQPPTRRVPEAATVPTVPIACRRGSSISRPSSRNRPSCASVMATPRLKWPAYDPAFSSSSCRPSERTGTGLSHRASYA